MNAFDKESVEDSYDDCIEPTSLAGLDQEDRAEALRYLGIDVDAAQSA